jgi:phage portal protein BeeE
MTSLLRSILRPESRYAPWAPGMFYPPGYTPGVANIGGTLYPLTAPQTSLGFTEEQIAPSYIGFAHQAMMANPIVFACMEYRRKTFSQAYFSWQRLRGGTPGEFFGTPELGILERPWLNATTPDLLNQAIQHADLGGNAFIVRRDDQLTLLRPDWVTIVAASRSDPQQGIAAIDAEVIGYAYWPGGPGYGDPELLLPEEVAHFAPTPDPTARFRGMSWLTPAIRDIMGDQAATTHKLKYFEQGATPNLVISLDPAITLDKFTAWVEKFDQKHEGVMNAYRTMYLGGGADAKVVGSDLKQIDFKVTQGAGESRIASDAGVPPILVGFSEGLASATYSNYGMARRAYIDSTLWDLWGNISGALQSILTTPGGARLWVDGRRIPLLQEDEKDRAEIQQMDAGAINTLVTSGYTPESVVDAVTSGDLTRLQHSGMYSVQLQPAGAGQEPDTDDTEEPAGRAAVAQARDALVAAGVSRPTIAQLADRLGVSDRTVRRWQRG